MVTDWTQIDSKVLYESENFVLIPWSSIPIKRSNDLVIAALSPRLNMNYFILSNEPIKNISSYSENTFIYVEDRNAKKIIAHFNPNVQFSTSKNECQLEVRLLPSDQQLWESENNTNYYQALSKQEFIPPVVSGILAAVTFFDDFDTRKFLANFHEENSKLFGNIERELEMNIGKQLLSAHVSIDRANYYHSNVVIEQDGKINFHSYSQSTILDYSSNFLEKI